MKDIRLDKRKGLPEALRVLLEEYPRENWSSDRGFNGLIKFWLERHMMFRQLLDSMVNDTQAVLDKKWNRGALWSAVFTLWRHVCRRAARPPQHRRPSLLPDPGDL